MTLGAWVETGARHETPEAGEWGASHFLEHLLFKGTDTRTAIDIAEAIESVGGEMNAFTTHEHTAFYVRIPSRHVERGVEILTDVLWHPAFRASEVATERDVILEEIAMRDDAPDDLVHDLLGRAMFGEHALGREVIGSRESITAMPVEVIAGYHERRYRADRVVFAVAGGFDADDVLELIAAQPGAARSDDAGVDAATDAVIDAPVPARSSNTEALDRGTEQTHLALGLRTFGVLDDDRYALAVLNEALGGGMSSRLFREVREVRGLAYSVFSYRAGFRDTGALAVYAGTATERVAETFEVVEAELDRLVVEATLPDDELEATKSGITGSLLMSFETSAARMQRIGRAEIVERTVPTIDETIAKIEAVDRDDVARVIDRVLRDAPRSLAVVGPGGAEPLHR